MDKRELRPMVKGRGRGMRLQVAAPLSSTSSYCSTRPDSESDTNTDTTEQSQFNPSLKQRGVNPKNQNAQEFGVPGVNRESDTILRVNDVKQSQELAFGYDAEYMDKKNLKETKLPTTIVQLGDKYFSNTDAKMKTGEEKNLLAHVMCVDEEDIFHVRCLPRDVKVGKQNYKIPVQETLEQLIEHMEYFYDSYDNKKTSSVGINNWFPEVGEVVVVQLTRKYYVNTQFLEYIPKEEYQRATILQIGEGFVTAKLLDEFGSGGVAIDNVFRIQPSMTRLPVQMFRLKLANMEYFKDYKIIHQVLRSVPIEGTMENYVENACQLQWVDSDPSVIDNPSLPRASLTLQLPILCTDRDRLPVKEHVMENLHHVLSPYAKLAKGESLCKVLRFDGNANLWIRMECNSNLLSHLYTTLEELRRDAERMMHICPLTITGVINPEHQKENLSKLYIAMLPAREPTEKKIRRVKIVGYNEASDLVQVINVDSGREHFVSITNLLPLDNFSKDLALTPPLALRVHLLHVKRLSTQSQEVKIILFSGTRRAKLAYEWPVPKLNLGYTPEVSLFPDTESQGSIDNLSEKSRLSGCLSGLAALLLSTKCGGIAYTRAEIKSREIIYNRVEKVKREVDCEVAKKHCSTFIGHTFAFAFTLSQVPLNARLLS